MSEINTDEHYMREALSLAKNGYGKVNPNPLVGSVIVKNENSPALLRQPAQS